MNSKFIISLIIVLVSFLDGVRDGNIHRYCSWWKWHIVKWVSFYSPLILLVMLMRYTPIEIAGLATVCYVVWHIGYNFVRL